MENTTQNIIVVGNRHIVNIADRELDNYRREHKSMSFFINNDLRPHSSMSNLINSRLSSDKRISMKIEVNFEKQERTCLNNRRKRKKRKKHKR